MIKNNSGAEKGDVEMTEENETRTAKNLEKLDDTMEEEPV